jgi:hypothetical protein
MAVLAEQEQGRAGHARLQVGVLSRPARIAPLGGSMSAALHRRRTLSALGTAAVLVLAGTQTGGGAAQADPHPAGPAAVTYDDFSKAGGYTLADYNAKWSNPYGLGEMALTDTRTFDHQRFNVSAAPFRTGADFSVFDHLKYIAISNQAFPVPAVGSVEISSVINARTPGTDSGRTVHGTYVASGLPYAATTFEGQQAGAVMNVVDFSTGQLFDWFISGHSAFALIERLPSSVTGNTTDTSSPDYVGRSKMYTQVIRNAKVGSGPHKVSIRFSRDATGGRADYYLDGRLFAHVDHVGVPLDRQVVDYTGTYPSLGPGEELGPKINSLAIAHGLFSLIDAFPFQHPDAPDLAVSVPLSERLFGQGAIATFDSFTVKTVG